ncbi:MAG: metallophosphoesterase family protein [Thermomicrobiales bacterium]
MRLALIADIHGNLSALDAVLAALQQERLDTIICLGDVAASGPYPREVLHRLRDLTFPVVMGNADAELLAPGAMPDESEDERKIKEISRWAADQLDAADRGFIASFRPSVEIDLGPGTRLLCCHGSPRNFNDAILAGTADDDLAAMFVGIGGQIVASGHTHIRMLRSWRDKELVNPGSVGLAYQFKADGAVRVPPWAEFAILAWHDGVTSVDFRRVAYDQDATVRAMTERGMPHATWWSADWG